MRADVAVVGGGPGGAASAIHLARRGFEVALFDRARFPRDKACGEFVNGAAVRMLASLGVDLSSQRAVGSVRFTSSTNTVETSLEEVGRSVRRTVLDAALLDQARQAGVSVFEGSNVRGIEGARIFGEGFSCEARLVIAADGSNSRIARQLGMVRPVERLRRVGVVAHVTPMGSVPEGTVAMFASRRGEWAVGGFCLQDDGDAVVSLVLIKGESQVDVAEWVRRRLGVEVLVKDLRSTACFGHRLTKPYAPGVLFVGDAARFVDPFTGEGIHHALEGAGLAAEVCSEWLWHGKSLRRYALRRRELEVRYLISDLVQWVVHKPALADRVASFLARRSGLAHRLFGVLTDSSLPWYRSEAWAWK